MKTNLKTRMLALLLLLAMLFSVMPMGAVAEETYTDVALTFENANGGYVFAVENGASLSKTYGAWKKLNLTVQIQSGASAEEATELVEKSVFFQFDESGKLHLYNADEYRALKLVIPAGTVVTPADDAGSATRLRIKQGIVLERMAADWGTTAGWFVMPCASEGETFTDIKLTYKDNSNGFTFNVDNTAGMSQYGEWKALKAVIQYQSGTTAEEAAAAQPKFVNVTFNRDGNLLRLYGPTEARGMKLIIPAGTIITPDAGAGSATRIRITKEVVLERAASAWGTNSGWVMKQDAPEGETYTDITLTHKDNSSGFTFTVDNTTGLSQYKDWTKLNVTVQYQDGTTVENAMAAEPRIVQVFFNKDGNLLHLYDLSEARGLKLVIPAGTIITPDEGAGSNVKLRVTNDVVLERVPSLYGQVNGWVQQVEQKDPVAIELDLFSTNRTDDWCFTPSTAFESTGYYLTNAIIDGKQTAVMMEYTTWDGGKLHIWSNTFAPGSAISATAPVKDFVIPAGTVLVPTNGFAKQITLKANGQPYVLTQELRIASYSANWKQIEMASANETYTDVKLLFHNASDGLIFNAESNTNLKNVYGAWKGLELYVIRSYSKASAAEAAGAKEYVKVTLNVDDDGRIHMYGAADQACVKMVVPAGSVIIPTSAASSNVKLRITNEIVLERENGYWLTSSGWLQNVDMPEAKDITITYNAVDANGNWSFIHTASDLAIGWYRMDAILDGVKTAVLVEYPDPSGWGAGMLYLYPHCMLPDMQATAKVPTTSLVIPAGAKLLPITASNGSLKEGAQPYTNAEACEVLSVNGAWPTNKVGSVEEYNMVLSDALNLNFYVEVAEDAVSDAQVEISVAGVTTAHKVADAETDAKGRYIFSVNLAAAQMTEEVTVQLVRGEQAEEAKTYTVRQYADAILADSAYMEYHDLVKEMLNYGAAAQNYFSYNAKNPANTGISVTPAQIPATEVEMDVTGNVEGVRFYGASLVHETKTAVRFYFAADSVEDITFTVGEKTYTAVAKDGMYYVEIAEINPQNLDDDVALQISDGATELYVTYAPVDYIIRMYNKADATQASKDLLQAMYGYHLAAEALAQPSAEVSVPEDGADPVL